MGVGPRAIVRPITLIDPFRRDLKMHTACQIPGGAKTSGKSQPGAPVSSRSCGAAMRRRLFGCPKTPQIVVLAVSRGRGARGVHVPASGRGILTDVDGRPMLAGGRRGV